MRHSKNRWREMENVKDIQEVSEIEEENSREGKKTIERNWHNEKI